MVATGQSFAQPISQRNSHSIYLIHNIVTHTHNFGWLGWLDAAEDEKKTASPALVSLLFAYAAPHVASASWPGRSLSSARPTIVRTPGNMSEMLAGNWHDEKCAAVVRFVLCQCCIRPCLSRLSHTAYYTILRRCAVSAAAAAATAALQRSRSLSSFVYVCVCACIARPHCHTQFNAIIIGMAKWTPFTHAHNKTHTGHWRHTVIIIIMRVNET